jgi:2-iminoacetate synthase
MMTIENNTVTTTRRDAGQWINERIKPEQIRKYLDGNNCFINEHEIEQELLSGVKPDAIKIKDILQKSLQIETLTPQETAYLLNVSDRDLLEEMKQTAARVKKKVYDNRIVTFAPLYLGNLCVNDCAYCGFRRSNTTAARRKLSLQEVKSETEVLAGQIGHKRLIVVYGEHPETDVDYIASTIQAIYDVKVKTRNGTGQIRRANVNAAPLSIEELELLKDVGIGTFQVFQETYHRPTYEKVHPRNTIKGNFDWRLYCMHRAMEAGVDDVGLGVLFGLYDWKFEVMGLLYHALELEKKFGIGPHTISFPRLEPASNTPFAENPGFTVGDEDFKKLVTVLRLAVPYTGMILTARENPAVRRDILPIGCTQSDASSCIGIGGYSEMLNDQQLNRQQFKLGDTRSLDAVIREFAEAGYITSFCTAGYRCGRTGKRIMKLLRTGTEGKFCKLNAVLTFREWLDDFAGPATLAAGQKILEKEIEEIRRQMPDIYPDLLKFLEKTEAGQRDLYF